MAVPFGPKENEWAWELKMKFRNIDLRMTMLPYVVSARVGLLRVDLSKVVAKKIYIRVL